MCVHCVFAGRRSAAGSSSKVPMASAWWTPTCCGRAAPASPAVTCVAVPAPRLSPTRPAPYRRTSAHPTWWTAALRTLAHRWLPSQRRASACSRLRRRCWICPCPSSPAPWCTPRHVYRWRLDLSHSRQLTSPLLAGTPAAMDATQGNPTEATPQGNVVLGETSLRI